MIYIDVCAGISASTVAWKPMGWRAAAYSEIDPGPRAVLAHHYPDVPLHGDFTTIGADDYGSIDLLVGGTPCQDFSVAGLRAGLDGERGNLSLEFLRLAHRKRPRWIIWENVPGVLSIAGGRAFGAILGGMAQLGYGFAYRILDAQFFGVPQRRRRVFVVAYLGDWRVAGAVLFERESLHGYPPPRGEARQIVAALTANGVGTCGADDNQAQAGKQHAVAFDWQSGGDARGLDPKETAQLQASQTPATFGGSGVRRLTPRECERLQGFPDDYTLVPYRGKLMSDGPRYKALGNSMAVPVMAWIGHRINLMEEILRACR